MQLPFLPYYTIKGSVLLQENDGNNIGITPTIKLNILLDTTADQHSRLFALLGTISNHFIFTLSTNAFDSAEKLTGLLPSYYLLSSLNNFSAGKPLLIPVWGYELLPVTTAGLQTYFDTQGVKNVQLPLFNQTQTGMQIQGNCSMYVCNKIEDGSGKTPLPYPTIISCMEAMNDINVFNQLTHLLEDEQAISTLNSNYVDRQQHEQEMNNWQERAQLYKSFLSLSKSVQQKEYYEVLDWYHKEYETLPLWFKRMGHLIKVATGKRSFRSLFNDNIKKYKD